MTTDVLDPEPIFALMARFWEEFELPISRLFRIVVEGAFGAFVLDHLAVIAIFVGLAAVAIIVGVLKG